MNSANRWKKILLAPTLGGLLLFGVASNSRSCNDCHERIHKAEENLRRAVDRHGEHSREAEQRRRELEEIRNRCRDDRDHDHDRH